MYNTKLHVSHDISSDMLTCAHCPYRAGGFPEDVTDAPSCSDPFLESGDDTHEESVTAGLHVDRPLILGKCTRALVIICVCLCVYVVYH